MGEQNISPMPWMEIRREVGQRWSRLEKMLDDYSSSQTYTRGLSAAIMQELLPALGSGQFKQFNQEQTELLHGEITGYLRNLCRIGRVTHILDRLCDAASWERNDQTTNLPFDSDFSMRLIFYPLVDEPKEIGLVEAVHKVFPDFSAKTEDAAMKGLQEGTNCLLNMFEYEIPLMAYRRDLLPFIDASGEFPEKFIRTNINEVYLGLEYEVGVDVPQLAFQVRPV